MIAGALLSAGLVIDAGEGLDFAPVVNLRLIQVVLQRFQLRRIGCLLNVRLVIVRFEGAVDVLGLIDEIQHERRVLAGDHAVESRQRLHRLNAVEPLVDVHRVQ